jgi:hypothetical protein
MKHTKGPWRLVNGLDAPAFGLPATTLKLIFSADNECIVDYVCGSTDDAHLIASAPEMLIWLEECLGVIKREHPANYAGLQDHVTKLIQRARGES